MVLLASKNKKNGAIMLKKKAFIKNPSCISLLVNDQKWYEKKILEITF